MLTYLLRYRYRFIAEINVAGRLVNWEAGIIEDFQQALLN